MPNGTARHVDAEPFRAWLAAKVQELGIGNVATAVGVTPRRIYTLVIGVYMQGSGNGKGRRYEVAQVELATVHEYMSKFGEHPEDIGYAG